MTALALAFAVEMTVLALAVLVQPRIQIPHAVALSFRGTPAYVGVVAGHVPFAFFDSHFASCLMLQGTVQKIVESLQQVKHKGGSHPPIRTLGMDDITGVCKIFAPCNPF